MNAKSRRQAARAPSVDDFDLRDHMLDVAIQLFAERGIAATTVAQIAAAAGVTSAMVHYYFTNREQLLDAIVEERLAQVIAFVWRPTEPQIETIRSRSSPNSSTASSTSRTACRGCRRSGCARSSTKAGCCASGWSGAFRSNMSGASPNASAARSRPVR